MKFIFLMISTQLKFEPKNPFAHMCHNQASVNLDVTNIDFVLKAKRPTNSYVLRCLGYSKNCPHFCNKMSNSEWV